MPPNRVQPSSGLGQRFLLIEIQHLLRLPPHAEFALTRLLPMRSSRDVHEAAYRRHRARGQTGWSADYAAAFDRLDQWLGSVRGDLLELGCGAGNYVLHLANRGWNAVGIDFSPSAIEWARERVARRARFVLGDVRALPFVSSAFDRVFDGHCWHCVLGQDRPGFLQEAYRVLRPGGIFTGATMIGPPTGLGLEGYDPATRQTVVAGVAVRHWTSLKAALADLRTAGFRVLRHELVPGGEEGPDLLWVDASRP